MRHHLHTHASAVFGCESPESLKYPSFAFLFGVKMRPKHLSWVSGALTGRRQDREEHPFARALSASTLNQTAPWAIAVLVLPSGQGTLTSGDNWALFSEGVRFCSWIDGGLLPQLRHSVERIHIVYSRRQGCSKPLIDRGMPGQRPRQTHADGTCGLLGCLHPG